MVIFDCVLTMGKKREGKGGSNKRSARHGGDSDEEFEELNTSKAMNSDEDEGELRSNASPMKTVAASDAPSTPIPSTATSSSFDMSEAMEMIREKKINMREPGLLNIIKFLQSSRNSEEENPLEHFHDTLLSLLLRMIRKPA